MLYREGRFKDCYYRSTAAHNTVYYEEEDSRIGMDKRKNMWLTTDDNPFNPFTQFDDWYDWDMKMGYDTCGRIARFAPTSLENLTDFENNELIDEAINKVLDLFDDQVYRLVFEETVERPNT